jgi:hypothetical protein
MNETELIGREIYYLRPKRSRLRGAVEIILWLSVILAIAYVLYGFAVTH